MPQALPALGALVVGAFSTGAATAMGASVLGTMVLGAIGGAIVGAAVGGLTAAITGGDIGKGLLFGAIGGAVTGGLTAGFSGPLNMATDLATGTQTMGSTIGTFDSVTGEVFTSTAGQAASSGAGGALGGLGQISQGAGMLGKAGLDMISAGMAPDPHVPFQSTQEGQEGQWAHEKEMAKLNASLRGGGGGGGAKLPWSTSEPGVKYQKGMEYKMNSENNAARMAELKKQYALQKDQTTHEFKLGRSVYEDAASAAASGEYKSGRALAGQAVVDQENAMAAAAGGQKPVLKEVYDEQMKNVGSS